MDLSDNLKSVFATVKDSIGDDGYADGDAVNQTLERELDDLNTDVALRVLRDDLGYIDGHRDGNGHWELIKLTGRGIQLSD